MRTKWVNFKELREQLKFADVLKHYGVELTPKGDQASGFCPLPTHNGEGHSPSFSANLVKGIWQCFGCGAKGNVLDFAVRMEGLSPAKPYEVRTIALRLQDRFGLRSTQPIQSKPAAKRPSRQDAPAGDSKPSAPGDLPVVINQPIDFELKGLDAEHPYLRRRGFDTKTIERFGLGYCARGFMAERIAIPIHNAQGRLIGYAGRLVDDNAVNEANPKYRFPSPRDREGVRHEFRKSLVVYNAHRVVEPASTLIVVEGFASVWWLSQHGFKDAVALMGWSCSPEQAQMIVSKVPTDGKIVVLPDGDDAGKRCAASVFENVGRHRSVQWLELGGNTQPTDFPVEQLKDMLRA